MQKLAKQSKEIRIFNILANEALLCENILTLLSPGHRISSEQNVDIMFSFGIKKFGLSRG